MAAVTGYAVITDTDGTVSQAVTVPANTDFCLVFLGADDAVTVNSITLDSVDIPLIVSGSGWAGTNRLFGVETSPGEKTFAYSVTGSFTNGGGGCCLVFLSGIDSVRASAGNGLSADGTLSLADITSQSGDLVVIIGAHDSYSSPGGQDVELNSQTAIFENQEVNYRGYGAGYKSATGSTITMQMTGNWPFACAAVLAPAVTKSAAITGTITADVNETDIVAGGKTIIITLTGDTWIS